MIHRTPPTELEKQCQYCGARFIAQRSTAKYCSTRCCQYAGCERRGLTKSGKPLVPTQITAEVSVRDKVGDCRP
jgi:hypothetical protein